MPPQDLIARMDLVARAELLELLTATRAVRADAIKAYYERDDGRQIAEVLITLEVDQDARSEILQILRDSTPEELPA